LNLYCAGRQKYVHLASDGSALHTDELIPWGQDALIELEFREGRYCIKSCDGRYLHTTSRLVDEANNDTMFTFEVKTIGQLSGLAFKDSAGKYLTATGSKGVVQARNRSIGKDELFTVEDSQPQVTFTAHNRKLVSIKQGRCAARCAVECRALYLPNKVGLGEEYGSPTCLFASIQA